MKFESPFSNTKFSALKAGDFFFHPLTGDHSPALKVIRADGKEAMLDLDLEQQDGSRQPSLVDVDDLDVLVVVSVPTAIIRPKPGIANIISGAAGAASIRMGSLIMTPTDVLVRVRGPNLNTLIYSVVTGNQVSGPDSAQSLWSTEWQVLLKDGDKETVIFERNVSPT
jgi:hypothetical protein